MCGGGLLEMDGRPPCDRLEPLHVAAEFERRELDVMLLDDAHAWCTEVQGTDARAGHERVPDDRRDTRRDHKPVCDEMALVELTVERGRLAFDSAGVGRK